MSERDEQAAAEAVRNLLWEREQQLLELRARWHALNVFAAELHEVTQGRLFEARGEATWNWMLDARDMFVIRLASWARSVYQPGGLFGVLGASHLHAFSPKYPRDSEASESSRALRREAFARLFPAAVARGRPNAQDLVALKDRFANLVAPVVDDRDEHRAHPYERRKATTSLVVPHPEFLDYFERIAGFFSDLRVAAGESPLVHHDDLLADDPHGDAREMVDAVLLGGSARRGLIDGTAHAVHRATGRWPYEHRAELYDQLRAIAADTPVDEPFNGRDNIDVLAERFERREDDFEP